MKQIELVIFDWAGTTIDYGCFAPVESFIEAFKQYDIEPSIEEVRKPMGMLKIDHIRTMLGMERINSLWQEKHARPWTEDDVEKIYSVMERKTLEILPNFVELKPGLLETVEKLREKGIKIGSTTGYTDEMMSIVLPIASKKGYKPDFWISPNGVNNFGRPYPYMIFRNLERLEISSVKNVIKVGDTISDIKEGKNAGLISVGVIEGSSIMGLSQEEYEALSEDERQREINRVENSFKEAGADYVIKDIRGILDLI